MQYQGPFSEVERKLVTVLSEMIAPKALGGFVILHADEDKNCYAQFRISGNKNCIYSELVAIDIVDHPYRVYSSGILAIESAGWSAYEVGVNHSKEWIFNDNYKCVEELVSEVIRLLAEAYRVPLDQEAIIEVSVDAG